MPHAFQRDGGQLPLLNPFLHRDERHAAQLGGLRFGDILASGNVSRGSVHGL